MVGATGEYHHPAQVPRLQDIEREVRFQLIADIGRSPHTCDGQGGAMFRLLKLSPPHGWRAVAWELAIVTLGVLIALAAQQAVEDIHRRADERALRETIDHEIGLNLFVYHVRSRQFACGDKRIAALRSWLDRARSGEQVPALAPRGPQTLSPYRSAWDNRDAEVFNGLPSELRQKYAEFYDEISSNSSHVANEADGWARLIAYAETGPLTLTDRRAIRSSVAGIQGAHEALKANLPISLKIAEALKVEEVQPDNMPADWPVKWLKLLDECRPVIASPA